jgi:hypothetical protein
MMLRNIEALRIAFDDNRQRVVLHADIVVREATPGFHRILLGWTGRWVKDASWTVSYQDRFSDAVSSSNQMPLQGPRAESRAFQRATSRYEGARELAHPQLFRQRSVAQHGVMKIANVKFCPQPLLCLSSLLHDLQLPYLVGKRLRRPTDVAIHLRLRLRRSMRLQIFLCLLLRPSHRVNSGINHQPSWRTL